MTISNGTLAYRTNNAIGQIQLRGGVLATTGTFSRTLGTTATSVNFGAGGGGFAAYGGALTVSTALGTWGSTANSLSNGTALILGSRIADNVVTLSSNLNLGGAAGTNRVITLVDNTNSAADAAVISGAISGAANLQITGSGLLSLTGATNSYGGTNTIGGVTLRVTTLANAGTNSSIGTNATIIITNGGVLEYVGTTNSSMNRVINLAAGQGGIGVSNSASTLTISGVISNSGSLVKSGAGTLTLTATNTYSGTTTISAGALKIGDNGTTGTLGAGNVTNDGTLIFHRSNDLTASNAISGTGALSKLGAGTLTVTGTNTYTGTTTIGAGALQVGAGGTAGALGTNNVTNNGALIFNRSDNLTAANVISGTGSLSKLGAGTLIVTGPNTYTGATTISGGTLLLSNAGTISTNTLDLAASGATLNISNITAATVNVAALSGVAGSTVSMGAKNMSFGGNNASTTFAGVVTGSGNLTKNGTGTTTLSGANTYTGSAIVSAGTLRLNNTTGSALASITNVTVASDAVLLVAQSNQVNNASTVSLSGGTIRTGAGVTETFGNLNVSSASFLDFGATFGNASSMNFGTYTPSSLLSIDNFNFGSTLTFKTDLTSSITNSSLFAFSNGGISSFNWDGGTSTFTITAIPEPSTVLAAAGLLGLMLWASRRRILAAARGLALRA